MSSSVSSIMGLSAPSTGQSPAGLPPHTSLALGFISCAYGSAAVAPP